MQFRLQHSVVVAADEELARAGEDRLEVTRADRRVGMAIPALRHAGRELGEGERRGRPRGGGASSARTSPRGSIALAPLSQPSTQRAEARKSSQAPPNITADSAVATSRPGRARARRRESQGELVLDLSVGPEPVRQPTGAVGDVELAARHVTVSPRQPGLVVLVDVARQALLEPRGRASPADTARRAPARRRSRRRLARRRPRASRRARAPSSYSSCGIATTTAPLSRRAVVASLMRSKRGVQRAASTL